MPHLQLHCALRSYKGFVDRPVLQTSSPLACVLHFPLILPTTTEKLNDIFNAERAQFCEVLDALALVQTLLKWVCSKAEVPSYWQEFYDWA